MPIGDYGVNGCDHLGTQCGECEGAFLHGEFTDSEKMRRGLMELESTTLHMHLKTMYEVKQAAMTFRRMIILWMKDMDMDIDMKMKMKRIMVYLNLYYGWTLLGLVIIFN